MKNIWFVLLTSSVSHAQLTILSLGDTNATSHRVRAGFDTALANDGITTTWEGLYTDSFGRNHEAVFGSTYATQLTGVGAYPGLATTISNYEPDVVLLMQGTKSIADGVPTATLELEFDTLVDFIFANTDPGTIILAGSIWDYTYAADVFSTDIQIWNQALADNIGLRRSQGQLIQYVDNSNIQNAFLQPNGIDLLEMGAGRLGSNWYPAYQATPIPEPSAFLLVALVGLLFAAVTHKKTTG